jgi:hypothetical protein
MCFNNFLACKQDVTMLKSLDNMIFVGMPSPPELLHRKYSCPNLSQQFNAKGREVLVRIESCCGLPPSVFDNLIDFSLLRRVVTNQVC